MLRYLAWKGGNGVFSRWHIHDHSAHFFQRYWTLCGKPAPVDAQFSGEQRINPEDTCKTCQECQAKEQS